MLQPGAARRSHVAHGLAVHAQLTQPAQREKPAVAADSSPSAASGSLHLSAVRCPAAPHAAPVPLHWAFAAARRSPSLIASTYCGGRYARRRNSSDRGGSTVPPVVASGSLTAVGKGTKQRHSRLTAHQMQRGYSGQQGAAHENLSSTTYRELLRAYSLSQSRSWRASSSATLPAGTDCAKITAG